MHELCVYFIKSYDFSQTTRIRELKICSSSTVSWDSLLLPLRFGMALLGCIHKQLTTLHGGNPSHGKLISSCTKRWEFDPSHSKLVVDFAVSREQTNEKGEKMYIQTRMAEYAEELWELLEKKRQHLCLHGMEKGIDEIMISLAAKDGWGILNRDRLVGVQEAIKEE
ncbi:hypothetical protein HID58_007301 [Brassica napus]|uniref:Protein kinase domain-containing protein n=1 Tax=Brassica napus TaxID=3708 RepID=A0ABQ8EE04_BRANA|nr:hypothetical protein HID58_007301 [Brassica napus]